MAAKKSSSTESKDDVTVVQRVSVASSKPAKAVSAKKASNNKSKTAKTKRRLRAPHPIRATGGYFAGAWHELRSTKWPTRRATWSLTIAVLIFTALLMAFIVAIDYLFNWLFQQIIL